VHLGFGRVARRPTLNSLCHDQARDEDAEFGVPKWTSYDLRQDYDEVHVYNQKPVEDRVLRDISVLCLRP